MSYTVDIPTDALYLPPYLALVYIRALAKFQTRRFNKDQYRAAWNDTSDRNFKRHMRELEDLGLAKTFRGFNPNGTMRTPDFQIVIPKRGA